MYSKAGVPLTHLAEQLSNQFAIKYCVDEVTGWHAWGGGEGGMLPAVEIF